MTGFNQSRSLIKLHFENENLFWTQFLTQIQRVMCSKSTGRKNALYLSNCALKHF